MQEVPEYLKKIGKEMGSGGPKSYVLDKNGDVQVADWITGAWFLTYGDRQIADTYLPGIRVSTVFICMDHNFRLGDPEFDDQRPLVFETMIFGGPEDGYQERYATIEEARQGHRRAVLVALQTHPLSKLLGRLAIALLVAAVIVVLGAILRS